MIDATKKAHFAGRLSSYYRWDDATEEEFDALPEDERRRAASGTPRKRVLVEEEGVVRFGVVDPAQMPNDSLSRYVSRALLGTIAPLGSWVEIGPMLIEQDGKTKQKSTAKIADVRKAGQKIAVLVECDWTEES